MPRVIEKSKIVRGHTTIRPPRVRKMWQMEVVPLVRFASCAVSLLATSEELDNRYFTMTTFVTWYSSMCNICDVCYEPLSNM